MRISENVLKTTKRLLSSPKANGAFSMKVKSTYSISFPNFLSKTINNSKRFSHLSISPKY
jgi:hypothetical protein